MTQPVLLTETSPQASPVMPRKKCKPTRLTAVTATEMPEYEHSEIEKVNQAIYVFLKSVRERPEACVELCKMTLRETSSLLIQTPKLIQKPKDFSLVVENLSKLVEFCIATLPEAARKETKSQLKTLSIASSFFSGHNPISEREKHLGGGQFSIVSQILIYDEPYAKKTLFNQHLLTQELNAILVFNHPHIIQVVLANDSSIFLELAENGCLKTSMNLLKTKRDLLRVLYQVADGLSYMHEKGYVHEDIKAANILLDADLNAIIADMGTVFEASKFTYDDERNIKPSIFSPPEHLEGKLNASNCQTIDVWAFGLLIWTLLKDPQHDMPYGDYASIDDLLLELEGGFITSLSKQSLQSKLDPKKVVVYDPEEWLVNLMMHCLSFEIANRPTMHQIKEQLREVF